MTFFSKRKGLKSVRNVIQKETMDNDLRVGLWNVFYTIHVEGGHYTVAKIVDKLWTEYYKFPIDESPSRDQGNHVYIFRKMFFEANWYVVYDLLEAAVAYCDYDFLNEQFVDNVNLVLERELSAYRFVGSQIAEITSEQEITSIETALALSPNVVQLHLQQALEHFADRKNPDYRNSIKESISAVESLCSRIVEKPNVSLGDALKEIEKQGKVKLHPSLRTSFEKLYGYTSNADGIRHALMDEPNLDSEDAKFMLVSCSAFINYLIEKAQKAGIKL
jgi:hypothetical protein